MNPSLRRIVAIAQTPQTRLHPPAQRRANNALARAGFDGNGIFRTIGEVLAKMSAVLAGEDIEIESTLNANLFRGLEGQHSFGVAFTNSQDLHSPISITNSLLFFSWDTRESGSIEALAYLS